MAEETKAVKRFRDELGWSKFLLERLEESATDEQTKLNVPLLRASVENQERIISCIEEGKPFIASFFACAPEIYTAMNLPWYCFMAAPFFAASSPFILDDVDECERIGLGTDFCTAIRLAIYYVETGLVPPPTACIGLLHPCDGTLTMHQIVQRNPEWRNVPMFGADPPYHEDERTLKYYANELKQMASFLEEHTGLKLDMDRLREVLKEGNQQYAMWAEYNELRRSVPCPHGFGMGAQAFGVAANYLAGDPRGTAWFKELLVDAERLVREKKGAVENERMRLLWFDIRPNWVFELFPWLEQEWGAVVVMDMFSYTPYTPIDTSTEDSIFLGLAKRNLYDQPMIRQARGVADLFASDIARIVKDYKIDAVIWPGHMGHKDGSASIGIQRELCREIGVPYLHIGLDLFDPRYAGVDNVKNKLSEFFTAMGLG